MSIESIRQALERVEAQRSNPFLRVRADELRAILDELDQCEQENAGLFRAVQAAKEKE